MGDPNADRDNPMLKLEQDSQVIFSFTQIFLVLNSLGDVFI